MTMADPEGVSPDPERRSFLATGAMAGGLIAGYGAFGAIAVRFLYPARPGEEERLFVADLASFKPGDSMVYRTPAGQPVAIARIGSAGTKEDFLALSSTCPHLGCQVHWEPQNRRFFCPCHNGVFDPSGKAVAGPPADAGQSLLRYPVEVANGLLYILVPVDRLSCPGRDRCPRMRPA
jgi:cytochrome b6-f complex iron-sulfur subunit